MVLTHIARSVREPRTVCVRCCAHRRRSTATTRPVTVARAAGDISVLSGGEVRPGDRVVTDGQLRLRPGSKVQVKTTATTAGENET